MLPRLIDEGFNVDMLADLLYILSLAIMITVAAVSLASRLNEAKLPPDLPDFVIRQSDSDKVILFIVAAMFSFLTAANVLFGDYSANIWLPPAQARSNIYETIVILASPLFLSFYSVFNTGKRLVVQGDMLDYKKHMFSRKRTFYIHDINRIERSAKDNKRTRYAGNYDYHFYDREHKELFLLDERSKNLSRIWDMIYRYRHINSFYDLESREELAFITRQREQQVLSMMRRFGESTVPTSFIMSFAKSLVVIFLIGGVFMAGVAVFRMPLFTQDPTSVYGTLIFSSFSLLCFFGSFVLLRQRIIVHDDTLYVMSLISNKRRPRVIAISDITECRYFNNGNIRLYIGKKKVLSIDQYMRNSQVLLAYLIEKGVPMPDKRNIGFGEQ